MASPSAARLFTSSVDNAEIEKFSRMADAWWDPNGKFKPLHQMNPVRLDYLRRSLCHLFARDASSLTALDGLRLLDVGCGGGLVSEPLARMGAAVTGIDAAEKNIAVAEAHAAAQKIQLAYRCTTAEALAEQGEQYDAVCALEIIEHVADPAAFLHSLAALVKPGGALFLSTLNRTPKSYLMAILGAEYILRLLPRGTHEWKKFIRPSELQGLVREAGLELVEQTGMVLDPRRWQWKLHPRDLEVNYLMLARKPR